MNSNKAYSDVQSSRIYQLEDRIYGRRTLLRFKANTGNIVENALRLVDEMRAEEMQREKTSPSRMEKYLILQSLSTLSQNYLKRFCEGKV